MYFVPPLWLLSFSPALLRGKRLNSSNLFDQFIVSYFTPNSSLFRAHLPAKRGAIIAAGAVSVGKRIGGNLSRVTTR
ncbi:hypothetical protein GPALN_003730 [Globodera pallida]|nr:hypothetical protein GPALN_003730 [Globodera pallida]